MPDNVFKLTKHGHFSPTLLGTFFPQYTFCFRTSNFYDQNMFSSVLEWEDMKTVHRVYSVYSSEWISKGTQHQSALSFLLQHAYFAKT